MYLENNENFIMKDFFFFKTNYELMVNKNKS